MKLDLTALAVISMAAVQALAVEGPLPTSHSVHWFCGVPGARCTKRSAEPEPLPAALRLAKGRVGFCGVPGSSCAKLKRSAEAVRDAFGEHWKTFDYAKTGAAALCNVPGEKCDVAAQAIGDVSETAENAYHELLARKAHSRKNRRSDKLDSTILASGGIWFCGVPGESCGVKKRSVHNVYEHSSGAAASAAKALNSADPNYLKTECAKEGNECYNLLKAYSAFHHAKREAEAIEDLDDSKAKQAYCAVYGCDAGNEEYFKLLHAGNPEAKRMEEDCHAEDGECNLAQQSLDTLERSLDEAIAKIA